MALLKSAKEPFRFYTETDLPELTGLKAANLQQLSDVIKTAPGASIYRHTHGFLQQHQYLSPEPPNDFAYWIADILGERELGEELFSIDTMQYATLDELRNEIIHTIEGYIAKHPGALQRFAVSGEEFHFMKSVRFILQTNYTASDLEEFKTALQKVTLNSIYFHMFGAKLRLPQGMNDFSLWLNDSLAEPDLANKIASLDLYTHTLENLRFAIVRLIEKRCVAISGATAPLP